MMKNADLCIQCGSCFHVCPVVSADPRFLGPAAFTKVYRYTADSRDFSAKRLGRANLSRFGVWDCAKCLLCVEVCPKGIEPFELITSLHEIAVERNQCPDHEGYRHVKIFRRQVRHTGYINEFFLALGTLRLGMAGMLSRGIRLFFKGKMHFNFLFPRSTKRFELRSILRDKSW